MMASFQVESCERISVVFQQIDNAGEIDAVDATEQAKRLLGRYSECITSRQRRLGLEVTEVLAVLSIVVSHCECSLECEAGTTLVSALERAQLCGESFEGEFYTYMMSHDVSSKTDSFIGYTTNPLRDVYMHNERLIHDRNTGAAAGSWVLDVAMGPFPSRKCAMDCGRAWVDGTRGKQPKRKKAPFLSAAFGVNLFDRQQPLDEPFEDLLQRAVPPVYNEVYREMCK